MKTRTAEPGAPLSQERYMSSREFSELRGVSGVAVAARAAIIINLEKRKLVWWLQAMSLSEGGLRRVARELLALFPDRLGNKTAQSEECKRLALEGRPRTHNYVRDGVLSLEEFLIDLCINPRVQIRTASEGAEVDEIEVDFARGKFRELAEGEFKAAALPYFKDVIGSLIQYKRQCEQRAKENFQQTAISKKVWETLDYALATRSMVLLDGLEGRGKTEVVKAWCELHQGEARFVSLKGINNKTTAFREIAKALGIASGYGYKSTELQGRIEDVLQRSRLFLVIDEAHFIFNQRQRIYTRPELVDWIDTALCNRKIPVALVTTPQFMVCMTRAAAQVDWNYRQFRRRVKRYVKLPEKNTPQDIEAVALQMLPGAPAKALQMVQGYVLLTKRDLSAVGDVVDEIRAIQGTETLSKVTLEQVHQAIQGHLLPSDTAFAEALKATEKTARPRQTQTKQPTQRESHDEDTREDETGASRIGETRALETPRLPENLLAV